MLSKTSNSGKGKKPNRILSYFDLNMQLAEPEETPVKPTEKKIEKASKKVVVPLLEPISHEERLTPLWEQVILYLGTVIGALFSSAIVLFTSGGANFDLTSIKFLLSASIIAIFMMPILFEKLSVKTTAPFLAQFVLTVQNGVFWGILLSSISKGWLLDGT